MKNILNLLKEREIDIVFAETDVEGYCLVEAKAIFVNCHLSEMKTVEVILHESKHVLSHKDYIELYRVSYIFHSKFENEANEHMIESLIKENGGAYNYIDLIDTFKIGIGYEAKYQRRTQ